MIFYSQKKMFRKALQDCQNRLDNLSRGLFDVTIQKQIVRKYSVRKLLFFHTCYIIETLLLPPYRSS